VHAGADGGRQAGEGGDQHRQAQPLPAREAGWTLLGPLPEGELTPHQEDRYLLGAVRREAQHAAVAEPGVPSCEDEAAQLPPCESDSVRSSAGPRARCPKSSPPRSLLDGMIGRYR
jgi:hypothetical protein